MNKEYYTLDNISYIKFPKKRKNFWKYYFIYLFLLTSAEVVRTLQASSYDFLIIAFSLKVPFEFKTSGPFWSIKAMAVVNAMHEAWHLQGRIKNKTFSKDIKTQNS